MNIYDRCPTIIGCEISKSGSDFEEYGSYSFSLNKDSEEPIFRTYLAELAAKKDAKKYIFTQIKNNIPDINQFMDTLKKYPNLLWEKDVNERTPVGYILARLLTVKADRPKLDLALNLISKNFPDYPKKFITQYINDALPDEGHFRNFLANNPQLLEEKYEIDDKQVDLTAYVKIVAEKNPKKEANFLEALDGIQFVKEIQLEEKMDKEKNENKKSEVPSSVANSAIAANQKIEEKQFDLTNGLESSTKAHNPIKNNHNPIYPDEKILKKCLTV